MIRDAEAQEQAAARLLKRLPLLVEGLERRVLCAGLQLLGGSHRGRVLLALQLLQLLLEGRALRLRVLQLEGVPQEGLDLGVLPARGGGPRGGEDGSEAHQSGPEGADELGVGVGAAEHGIGPYPQLVLP